MSPAARKKPTSVEVLVDRGGRVGILSYLPAAGEDVRVGDGVEVPFGKSVRTGTVLGLSSDPRATRPILRRTSRRSGPAEVSVARQIAEQHLSELDRVAARLSPREGHEADPQEAGPLALASRELIPVGERDPAQKRWLLLRRPLTDPHRLAAQEAARIHEETGRQVLILCPTVRSVTATLACFESGAVRVDSRASAGSWAGFARGTAAVAVGTRSAALYRPKRLGGIIVVDHDQPGHVETTQPQTHAGEVAAMRAAASRCQLILISAFPDPAALGRNIKVVAAGAETDWPKISIIDRGQIPPAERLVPPRLHAAIRKASDSGITPVVLAERRSATLRCRQCRTLWPCDEEGCSAASCHHRPETACTRCGGKIRISVGFDKDRLASLLPGVRAVTLSELNQTHDAGLVIIFDISAAMRAAEWNPGQLAGKLLVSGAQAAGRGGSLIVCSWDRPDGIVTLIGRRKDQREAARQIWEQSRADGLPPFGHIVTITTSRPRAPRTDGWPGKVYGPRKQAAGGWETVVLCSRDELDGLAEHVRRLRKNGKVRVKVV